MVAHYWRHAIFGFLTPLRFVRHRSPCWDTETRALIYPGEEVMWNGIADSVSSADTDCQGPYGASKWYEVEYNGAEYGWLPKKFITCY
jgi:hypothetical protein